MTSLEKKEILNSLEKNGFYLYKDNLNLDTFDYMDFAKNFGQLMPQYGGELEVIVKPRKEFESEYYSQSRRELYPHTEAYEFEYPPKYIILQCLEPDRDRMGLTPICDTIPFFNSLPAHDIDRLIEKKYLFTANSGLTRMEYINYCVKPIYEKKDSGTLVRFSYNNMRYDHHDYFTKKILNSMMDYFYTNKSDLFLERGYVLILDNYRMLHARTQFYDYNRQIRRIWIA